MPRKISCCAPSLIRAYPLSSFYFFEHPVGDKSGGGFISFKIPLLYLYIGAGRAVVMRARTL